MEDNNQPNNSNSNQGNNTREQNNNNLNNNNSNNFNNFKNNKTALRLSTVGSGIIAVIVILVIIHFIKIDLIHKKETKINQELKQAHLNKIISYGGLNYHLLSGVSDINNIKIKNHAGQPINIKNVEIKSQNKKKGLINININGIRIPTSLISQQLSKKGIPETPSIHAVFNKLGKNIVANVALDTVPFNKNNKNKNKHFINVKHFNVNLHNLVQINSSFKGSIEKPSSNNQNSTSNNPTNLKGMVQNRDHFPDVYSFKIKIINKGLSGLVRPYILKNNEMGRLKQQVKQMKQQATNIYGKNPKSWPLRMHLKYEWVKTFILNQNKGFSVQLPEQSNNQPYHGTSFLKNIKVHSIPK